MACLTTCVLIPGSVAGLFIDCRPQDREESDHAFVVVARSDALEGMQGNFGKAIKADGDRSASHTNRGVSNHVTVFPWPRAHMPRQNGTKRDRNRPRQTD